MAKEDKKIPDVFRLKVNVKKSDETIKRQGTRRVYRMASKGVIDAEIIEDVSMTVIEILDDETKKVTEKELVLIINYKE